MVGALRVRVTGTDCGVFVAPVAVTIIVALNGPARSPAVFTDRVTGLVPVVVVPDVGASISQLGFPVRAQVKVPVPEFVMFNVFEVGLAAS